MTHFNISMVEGYLVKDPLILEINNNKKLCKFTIGNNRVYINKNGEKIRESHFFDVTAWSKLAINCGKYLKKGSHVLVSGNLKKNQWKDKEGKTKYTTFIESKEVNFLSH